MTAGEDQATEVQRLRARVAELEEQLQRKDAETAQLVATAQEKLYWLERWHIDLDRVMAKPGMIPALNAVRSARQVVWRLKKLKRRLTGSG